MRILVLGGTAWLGHAIATTAVRRGHDVTCVARGSGVPDGATAVQADRDDPDALHSVRGVHWDAVVDVARQPGHVRRAAQDLASVADRFVFVSSCSAYASQSDLDADEDAPLLAPLAGDEMTSPEDYGSAKVAGEEAVLDAFGAARTVILRPGLIGGPGDPTGRTDYWVRRFDAPSSPDGRVLVPDAPAIPTSIIDVRDLADGIVAMVERRTHGVFNAVGDSVPFPAHIETARRVAGHTGAVVRAPEDWLIAHGVGPWSGARSLPLWLPDPAWYGLGARSNARARAAGLRLRPLSETLADTLADVHRAGVGAADAAHGAGLTDDDERALLGALDASGPAHPG